MPTPLYTMRLGEVYIGQWAIHTPTGQIGQVVDWSQGAISFRIWGSTSGEGSAAGRGCISVDGQDYYRQATCLEISGYVNGDWSPREDGQDNISKRDPKTILTPAVPIILTQQNQELPQISEKVIDKQSVNEPTIELESDLKLEPLGLEQLHSKIDLLTQQVQYLMNHLGVRQ